MGGRAKAGVKKYQCISCSWEPQFIDFLVPHLQELSVGVNKDGSVSLCILMLWSGMCCRVQGCEEWVLWLFICISVGGKCVCYNLCCCIVEVWCGQYRAEYWLCRAGGGQGMLSIWRVRGTHHLCSEVLYQGVPLFQLSF